MQACVYLRYLLESFKAGSIAQQVWRGMHTGAHMHMFDTRWHMRAGAVGQGEAGPVERSGVRLCHGGEGACRSHPCPGRRPDSAHRQPQGAAPLPSSAAACLQAYTPILHSCKLLSKRNVDITQSKPRGRQECLPRSVNAFCNIQDMQTSGSCALERVAYNQVIGRAFTWCWVSKGIHSQDCLLPKGLPVHVWLLSLLF